MIETSVVLHRVVAAMDRAGDRALRTVLGISHSRAVLLLLISRSEPVSQRELADAFGSTEPAIARLVRELVADEFASVTVDSDNRRRRLVRLTDAGRLLVAQASRLMEDRFAALLDAAGVDSAELFVLLARLDKVLSSAGG